MTPASRKKNHTDEQVPITDTEPLITYLSQGCTIRSNWRIGTEHEKFAYRLSDHHPLSYDEVGGIRDLLRGLLRFGWQPIEEAGQIIALSRDGASVTLEPGGQIELSGAPLVSVHETCLEVREHLKEIKSVAEGIGAGLMGLGVLPIAGRNAISWMPKERYAIMRRYMPTKGDQGLDMMTRTATVQVNLDFESEADMVTKFRVAQALQPVAVALYANSPFLNGRPSGWLSTRSHIWNHTDPDRCGILPFIFDDGFGFERYVDYLLDVPMYFVRRQGRYIDAAGQSFRDFLSGRLPALPGEYPYLSDWIDHMSTVFTEVRLKRFLEMRGADGGAWNRLCALSAFWVGLLYDPVAQDAAWDLVKNWSLEDHMLLRQDIPKTALATHTPAGPMAALAEQVLEIAAMGLKRRGFQDTKGKDESGFLDPLIEIAQSKTTPAEIWLDAYAHRWNGSLDPIFTENAY